MNRHVASMGEKRNAYKILVPGNLKSDARMELTDLWMRAECLQEPTTFLCHSSLVLQLFP
jgi:hypothetical protein